MRGQRKNPRKAVQPFENKKRKIDIFKNYEANGVEKIQRKLEIFSTLISKKSNYTKTLPLRTHREKTFRGHLILTFMASVVLSLIAMQMQRKSWGRINLIANENAADKPVRRGRKPQFKPPEFNRMGMFKRLRNQKCNVYGSKVVPAVPYKPANDVSSFF